MAYLNNPWVINRAPGSGMVCRFGRYKEAASQSFLVGELVKLSSGLVAVAASDDTNILGIAHTAASGTANTEIIVEVIYPGDELEIVCSSTPAEANRGIGYGLVVASNVHKLDLTDTTNDLFQIVRLKYNAKDTIQTRAVATVKPGGCQIVTGA